MKACAIDPYCERGAGRCLFFLSPRMREGAERRKALRNKSGTSSEAPRAVMTGTHASRRSTAAIFYAITVLFDRTGGLHRSVSRQHWRSPSSDHVQPPKAGPSTGPDGDRASWDEAANPACRRRHPRSATERLRKAPSVNGDDVHHMQNECGCQIQFPGLQGLSTLPFEPIARLGRALFHPVRYCTNSDRKADAVFS